MEKDPEKTAYTSESDRSGPEPSIRTENENDMIADAPPTPPVKEVEPSSPTPGEIPDGGLQAWLQVVGSAA